MGWQKASGHNTRARAEAAVARWKQVIGNGLRSRKDERRATEVEVGAYALNRMLELGRPISVRIARPRTGLGRVRLNFGSMQHADPRVLSALVAERGDLYLTELPAAWQSALGQRG